MKIAIVAAGFTPSEADLLRRAMATFRKTGKIHSFHAKMVEGMVARGYERSFAERCFQQIEGFGEYGFPESHAASFALLVYVSAWLKCHYPAAFACALLNSQPMGFYAPAQIVRDAREHGVEVLPVDVNRSVWDHTLEPGADGDMALRLGFRQIKGLRAEAMDRLGRGARQRLSGPVDPVAARRPAGGGARAAGPRRRLHLARSEPAAGLVGGAALPAGGPAPVRGDGRGRAARRSAGDALPAMTLGEQVVDDYASVRMTLSAHHPLALLRAEAPFDRATPHRELLNCRNGQQVDGERSGADPPAAGHGQGRGVHDPGGRDRRRQRHRLAPCAGALPADRDGQPGWSGSSARSRRKASSSTSSRASWRTCPPGSTA